MTETRIVVGLPPQSRVLNLDVSLTPLFYTSVVLRLHTTNVNIQLDLNLSSIFNLYTMSQQMPHSEVVQGL